MMSSDSISSRPAEASEALQPQRSNDAAILSQSETQASEWSALARLQSGATVYSSDGAEVAVVDIVAPGRVTVRAGFPGRPLDLPTGDVASVSPDGQRLDIRLSQQDVERLVGQDQPGYAYLQAQQASTLHDRDDVQPPAGPDALDAAAPHETAP